MDLRERIKQIVKEVIEENGFGEGIPLVSQTSSSPNRQSSIAILLAYQSSNSKEVIQTVSSLLDDYEGLLIGTKRWQQTLQESNHQSSFLINELNQAQLQSIAEQTSQLVVPIASYHLLSKLALSMDDDAAVALAIQFQLLGKPVIIANNHVELSVEQLIHAPAPFQERLHRYIKAIQRDGVQWVPLNQLMKKVQEQTHLFKGKKRYLLAKHIEKAYQKGVTDIYVSPNTRITPTAKDLLKERNMNIVYKNS